MLQYDRKSEIQAFDDSKAGVKGLVDAGITKIPPIFILDKQKLDALPVSGTSQFSLPVIDLQGLDKDATQRGEIIEKIRNASKEWGFFQIVNHGIPVSVMDKMLEGVRLFHEQDTEVKKKYYSRDGTKKFTYNSNFDLHQVGSAKWRDSFYIIMAPDPPAPEELPEVVRDIVTMYNEFTMKLGHTMFELLSDALGLKLDHLLSMDCAKGLFYQCHYYPACPEPESTLGQTGHTDSSFLTLLIQDQIGGLQVLYENQWVDIPFMPGALVVNIGDLLQLISNDKFKSCIHRVVAKYIGPRISMTSFFRTHFDQKESTARLYGPIKELLSEENPPIYREVKTIELVTHRYNQGLDGGTLLSPFRLDANKDK